MCKECTAEREHAELESRLNYMKATIYIRKISPEDVTACLDPMSSINSVALKPTSDNNTTADTFKDLEQV